MPLVLDRGMKAGAAHPGTESQIAGNCKAEKFQCLPLARLHYVQGCESYHQRNALALQLFPRLGRQNKLLLFLFLSTCHQKGLSSRSAPHRCGIVGFDQLCKVAHQLILGSPYRKGSVQEIFTEIAGLIGFITGPTRVSRSKFTLAP